MDVMGGLLGAKAFAGLLLTAASLLGLIAPFWCFHVLCTVSSSNAGGRSTADSERSRRHKVSSNADGDGSSSVSVLPITAGDAQTSATAAAILEGSDERGALMVSYANCFSAGILLWTGLMHFFVESASAFATAVPPQVGVTSDVHRHSHGGDVEKGLQEAVMWMMLGIFIPLVVERLIWPWVTERFASGGNSGNTPPRGSSRTTSTNTGAATALGTAKSLSRRGTESNEDENEASSANTSGSLAAMLATHAHSHSHGGHATHSGSTCSPIDDDNAALKAKRGQARDVASAVLIAILMSVHSATEGVAVGVEPSIASLRQSVSPLVVHKIFDGWLVGLGAYRTADMALRSSSTCNVLRYLFFRSNQRYSLWTWIVALPLTLMIVALLTSPSASSSHSDGSSHQSSTVVAAAQATSSGSFLYIALCAILLEELSSSDTIAEVSKILKRNGVLIVGCLSGLAAGAVLSSSHHE